VQRLLFETSPILLLVCLAVAVAGAWFLYKAKHSWGNWTNRLLFLFRATLLFFIAALLLGPILKLITNTNEKPEVVLLIDNSQSVREVIDTAREVTGREIPTRVAPRRAGDPAVLIATSEKIKRDLGWKPKFQDLRLIIESAWEWLSAHPRGYAA